MTEKPASRQQPTPGFHVVEVDPTATRCDASVPSYYDDEVRYECGHEAEVEAFWTDGRWHPRCRPHVNGYPANRVRPLEGAR